MSKNLVKIINWTTDKTLIFCAIANAWHSKWEMAMLIMIFDQLIRIRQRLERKTK